MTIKGGTWSRGTYSRLPFAVWRKRESSSFYGRTAICNETCVFIVASNL